MINKELEAQISLLEDPDKHIYSLIHNNIINQGPEAIPFLENAWGASLVPMVHDRIENIIHEITFNQITIAAEAWVENGRKDWFTILFLISKVYYQNLNKDEIFSFFSKIKNEIWLEINDNLTAFEKIQIVNQILFKKYSFRKDSQSEKPNFLLSETLTDKKGNDLGLGILYMLICTHLRIPVYGVDLPGNFILAFIDPQPSLDNEAYQNEILFYINPLNNGTVFGMQEIDLYIEKNKLKSKDSFYQPMSNQSLLEKYIDELGLALEQDDDKQRFNELIKIKNIISI